MHRHARKQNLSELLNAAVVKVRAITVQRQSTTLAEAERVGVLATPYAAIFVPTTAGAPNRLEQLTAAAAAFRVELETKRQREVQRGTGTRGIHANATQATRTLAELDDLLSPCRDENPEFYAAYEQARQLIDEGVRTTDAAPETGKEVTQPKAA